MTPAPAADTVLPSRLDIVRSRRFWSLAAPRFFAEPTWQTLNFFIPLYLVAAWHVDLRFIARWAWLPFVGADAGVLFAGYLSPWLMSHRRVSLLASRQIVAVAGALGMGIVVLIGLAGRPETALLLLCAGAFAHQMLAGMLVTMTADLFPSPVVGTAAGLAGSVSWTGGLLFTALLGILADRVGYPPLFVLLSVFDVISAVLLLRLLDRRWTAA